MRANYIKKFYGIGIGPGDPQLMTLKALNALKEADVIFAPRSGEDTTSCARAIISKVLKKRKKIVELKFPMTRDKGVLTAYWQKAASKIATALKNGGNAAFVTIGDPLIYSTYIYLLDILRKQFPDIKTVTIPGISAFNAASSRLQIPLVCGNETMAVLPVANNLNKVRKFLKEFDTVVLMKIGSSLNKLIPILKEMKLIKNSILISRVGYPDETIIRDLATMKDMKPGYMSVIIIKRNLPNSLFSKGESLPSRFPLPRRGRGLG